MPKFTVVYQDMEDMEIKKRAEVEADGYAVDNNSNLFFFNDPATSIQGAPPQPPKPTTTFAHDTWFRVEKA
jgi:hypothetical protein